MQDRAADASLGVKPVSLGAENFKGVLTDSYAKFLGGLYALRHPRHIRPVGQTDFGNETIDNSVDSRRRDAPLAYRPANSGIPAIV
jgi:hypothetical protein